MQFCICSRLINCTKGQVQIWRKLFTCTPSCKSQSKKLRCENLFYIQTRSPDLQIWRKLLTYTEVKLKSWEFILYPKMVLLHQTNAQRTSESPREPQTIMEEWTFWTNPKMPVWTISMWCFLNSILISLFPVFGMLYSGSYFMTFPFHRYPRKAFTPHSPYHFIVIEPRGGSGVSCKTWSIIVQHHHYQQWLSMTCESI